MIITTRQATLTDIPQLLRLEKCWPESERATEAQLYSRLNLYSEGYFVGSPADTPDLIIAAFASSPIKYVAEDLDQFCSWEKATNNGSYYPNCFELSNHSLYIAASCVDTKFRGGTVYLNFMNQVLDLLKSKGVSTVISGNVLPGYDRYCKKRGEISAADYVFTQHKGLPIDPFLKLLYQLGFVVPDKDHVIKDYYHDEPSRHYASIIVNDLTKR